MPISRFLRLLAVYCAWCLPAFGDDEMMPFPYAAASDSGRQVFVMSPAIMAGQKAMGIAYSVGLEGSLHELWRTEGWYSFRVFISDDGESLVRLGPWIRGSTLSLEHLAVAFYRHGELLKQYSTADLVKDPTKLRVSVSHYHWLLTDTIRPPAAYVGVVEPGIGYDGSFRLTTVDGIVYRFDLGTGAIKESQPLLKASDRWASVEDIDRLSIAVSLLELPVAESDLDRLLGLRPGMREPGSIYRDETYRVVLTPSNDPKGHYFLSVAAETPAGAAKGARRVTAVSLGYASGDGHRFIHTPTHAITRNLPRLREEMHANHRTPFEESVEMVSHLNGRLIFLD